MPLYLNKNNEAFSRNLRNEIYVDKSEIISDLNKLIPTDYRFLCVTRPRRFGKTMTLSMLNAYYSKGCDSRALFEDKQIRKDSSFEEHLNKHHVLWLDMAGIFSSLDNKRDFVRRLKYILLRDFREAYPNIDFNDCELNEAFALIHSKTGDRFIFLIDEWDVIFREMPSSDLCNDYIMFLRSLFKASDISSCFDLVYMTGILPIRRYTTESALNMFSEYNMLNPKSFSAYIGFTEEEVHHLCDKHDIDFEMMKKWYNGYHFGKISVYNPKSVVEAITERKFSDYWTSTGALESVTNYMNYDNGELKEVITRMLTGEKVQLNVMKFSNDLTKINSRDAALTVLVHLGYLAYDEETKSAYIPNYEIQNEFETALDELN